MHGGGKIQAQWEKQWGQGDRADDSKAKKELVIQKVQTECCGQRGLPQTQGGDAGTGRRSGEGPEEGGPR